MSLAQNYASTLHVNISARYIQKLKVGSKMYINPCHCQHHHRAKTVKLGKYMVMGLDISYSLHAEGILYNALFCKNITGAANFCT